MRPPEGIEWVGPWRLIKDHTVTQPQWRRFVSGLIPAEQAGLKVAGYSNCVIIKLRGSSRG